MDSIPNLDDLKPKCSQSTRQKFQSNLRKLEGPNDAKSFSVGEAGPKMPDPVVLKAMTKHLSQQEINKVYHGYRRSVMDTTKLINDVLEMDLEPWDIIEDEHLEYGLKKAEELMLKDKMFQPVHFCDLRYYPWKWGVSACQPYIDDKELKEKVKDAYRKKAPGFNNDHMSFKNVRNVIFNDARIQIHSIKDGVGNCHRTRRYRYDIMAFGRAHLVEETEEDKIRFVYGVPRLTILAEMMFLWPLFDYAKQSTDNHVLAWGFETLKGGAFKLNQEWTGSTKCTTLCLDWKKFDKKVHFRLIDKIHEIWKRHISFENGYVPSHEYPDTTPQEAARQKERLERLWTWMCNSIKHSPIRTPDGASYERQFAGVPSGVLQTNYLDSWANLVVLLTCLHAVGIEFNEKCLIRVMGDDSKIILPYDYDWFVGTGKLKQIAIEAKRRFNFVINTKKSFVGRYDNDAPFLGYRINHGWPFKDRTELLCRLAYPERRNDWESLAARAIGIAYASAGVDETVYHICKDVYDFLVGVKQVRPRLSSLDYYLYEVIGFDGGESPQFPSLSEIRRRIFNLESKTDNSEYMPSDVFLHEKLTWRL